MSATAGWSGGSASVEFGTLAEQEDETHYDNRIDADDDLEKGRMKFPTKLYGRGEELDKLNQIYKAFGHDSSRAVVFLAGFPGTGKSALVGEFISNTADKHNKPTAFISGKFGQIKTGHPFSAICQAMNQHLEHYLQTTADFDVKPFKRRLSRAGIKPGSDLAVALSETLIPSLNKLLKKRVSSSRSDLSYDDDDCAPPPKLERTTSSAQDLNIIKYAFQNYVKALAAETKPVTIFIDDLQWADETSIQLLTALLKDNSLHYVLFIGAYRGNELNSQHVLSKLIAEVKEAAGPKLTHSMEISNLSPERVAQFIADAMSRDVEEIGPVAEAVYCKTLGNIFFVRQALEELVRKNALYYDVICFSWRFGDVTRVELEQFLSNDVVKMVQSKLQTLPRNLQKALALAAYTKNTIEQDVLAALLRAESVEADPREIKRMMRRSFAEGLVVGAGSQFDGSDNHTYKFAHAHIREAACASVPAGDERHKFLLRLSTVLLELGSQHDRNDWMLFAAARHMSSIPATLTDSVKVVELNLKVGKIAVSKGAFGEAVIHLRNGARRLDPKTCWQDHYRLTLDLKNYLMETERRLRHNETAIGIAKEICRMAKALSDKSRAHFAYIEALTANDTQYTRSLAAALEISPLYNIKLPSNPSRYQVQREKCRLMLSLRGRSLACLAHFPIATNKMLVAKMKMGLTVLLHANFARESNLAVLVGYWLLRMAVDNELITKDIPIVLVMSGTPLRGREKYRAAFMFADASVNLMGRFPKELGLEFIKAKFTMFVCLGCLRVPFREAFGRYLDLSRVLFAKGESDMGLGAGMVAMLSFLNSSLPLNAFFEGKLAAFDEISSSLGRDNFCSLFRLIQQCLHNLQNTEAACSNPSDVNGVTFSVDEARASSDNEAAWKMLSRDIATIRLMLAVIFNDEVVMEEMLNYLDAYPVFDFAIPRQHMRMTFAGFASAILSRKFKKHIKWSKITSSFFRKLSGFGSANAAPVYLCIKALQKPSLTAFEQAIQSCGRAGLLNLAAIMNEHCGLHVLQARKVGLHEEFMKCATWLYHDWGAKGKVDQLKRRYVFLQTTSQDKVPPRLTSLHREASKLWVPEASDATDGLA